MLRVIFPKSHSISVLKSKSVNDPSTMSGGIFGSEVFGYEKTNYFWTNDYRDFCAGSIDESKYNNTSFTFHFKLK